MIAIEFSNRRTSNGISGHFDVDLFESFFDIRRKNLTGETTSFCCCCSPLLFDNAGNTIAGSVKALEERG